MASRSSQSWPPSQRSAIGGQGGPIATRSQIDYRHVERPAPQVIDQRFERHAGLADGGQIAKTFAKCQPGGRRFVDDINEVQPGHLSGVGSCLAARLVEEGRHRDDHAKVVAYRTHNVAFQCAEDIGWRTSGGRYCPPIGRRYRGSPMSCFDTLRQPIVAPAPRRRALVRRRFYRRQKKWRSPSGLRHRRGDHGGAVTRWVDASGCRKSGAKIDADCATRHPADSELGSFQRWADTYCPVGPAASRLLAGHFEHNRGPEAWNVPSERTAAMSLGFDPYQKWLGIRTEERPPMISDFGISGIQEDRETIVHAADRNRGCRRFQWGSYQPRSQRILNELAAAKLCFWQGRQENGLRPATSRQVGGCRAAARNRKRPPPPASAPRW